MTTTLDAQVLHVVPPDEHEDAEMQQQLVDLAESRHVLVCRKGGAPSLFERIKALLGREPIHAITLVADSPVPEGEDVRVRVAETAMTDVYDVQEFE